MKNQIVAEHGPISCRQCWANDSGEDQFTTADGRFRVVNDPGAWGAADPTVLVLGISKGFTQARAFAAGEFDQVPFKDCRDRLQSVLEAVGVMESSHDINSCMKRGEKVFGWGSLVRCSLSGWNKQKQAYGAGTPEVLPAFKHREARAFLTGCMDRFLKNLPGSVKLVCLLGNDDRYVAVLSAELRRLYPDSYSSINAVAHRAGGIPWVHLGHPSRGNGFYGRFVSGDPSEGQGLKRALAKQVIDTVSI